MVSQVRGLMVSQVRGLMVSQVRGLMVSQVWGVYGFTGAGGLWFHRCGSL